MDKESLKCSSGDTNINRWIKLNMGGSKTRLAGLQRLSCVPPHLPGKQLDCP